jgi:hypothetical protein
MIYKIYIMYCYYRSLAYYCLVYAYYNFCHGLDWKKTICITISASLTPVVCLLFLYPLVHVNGLDTHSKQGESGGGVGVGGGSTGKLSGGVGIIARESNLPSPPQQRTNHKSTKSHYWGYESRSSGGYEVY